MNDRQSDSTAGETEEKPEISTPVAGKRKKRANMHEGLGVWCDCCTCEAEPYWAAVAEELGIDLSDYEKEDATPPQKK